MTELGRVNDALTVAEVARELRLSEKTVRRAISSGDLVAHRLCAHWRIFRDDVDAWVEASRNVAERPIRRRRRVHQLRRQRGSLRALEMADGDRRS
jgi:excisionase family DNA binding protein